MKDAQGRVSAPGILVAFEGIDGSGKSSTLRACQTDLNQKFRSDPVIQTREPGGTPRAEKIRRLLLAHQPAFMNPFVATSMFASARADLVHRVIKPALRRGRIILMDRCLMSSLVYQSTNLTRSRTGAVSLNLIWQANDRATDHFKVLPDLILCFTAYHRSWVIKKLIRRIRHRYQTDWLDQITSNSIRDALKLDGHYLYWAHHWKACPVVTIKASLPLGLRTEIASRLIWRFIQNRWLHYRE